MSINDLLMVLMRKTMDEFVYKREAAAFRLPLKYGFYASVWGALTTGRIHLFEIRCLP